MSRFVLQPCKLRGDRIVPEKAEPLVLKSKAELIERFQAKSQMHLAQLRQLRVTAFVGTVVGSRSQKPSPFIIWNHDRSNRVRWLFNQDPQFGSRVLEVFRVEEVDWGASIQEADSGKKDMPTWQSRKNAPMTEA